MSLGANWAKAFLLSVMPNIRSGLMSAFILAFINAFNDVSIGVFVSGPGVLTLPMAMLGYAETRMDPTIAAMAVMLMLMTMAFTTFRGLTCKWVSEGVYNMRISS
ncbi:hypothetical protein SDC9_209198 [bioreactor metagenome]|uniref:ABC transmembrane type-1 domain-containing protein n=1 Tax=bioreactor metagenome TaxID=1076179 RepID=A0A645JCS3_9ZZZZ